MSNFKRSHICVQKRSHICVQKRSHMRILSEYMRINATALIRICNKCVETLIKTLWMQTYCEKKARNIHCVFKVCMKEVFFCYPDHRTKRIFFFIALMTILRRKATSTDYFVVVLCILSTPPWQNTILSPCYAHTLQARQKLKLPPLFPILNPCPHGCWVCSNRRWAACKQADDVNMGQCRVR